MPRLGRDVSDRFAAVRQQRRHGYAGVGMTFSSVAPRGGFFENPFQMRGERMLDSAVILLRPNDIFDRHYLSRIVGMTTRSVERRSGSPCLTFK